MYYQSKFAAALCTAGLIFSISHTAQAELQNPPSLPDAQILEQAPTIGFGNTIKMDLPGEGAMEFDVLSRRRQGPGYLIKAQPRTPSPKSPTGSETVILYQADSGAVTGRFSVNGRVFDLRRTVAGQHLIQPVKSNSIEDATDEPEYPFTAYQPKGWEIQLTTPLRVLVAYDTAVLNHFPNWQAVRDWLYVATEYTNDAYANSGVDIKLEFAHLMPVTDAPSNSDQLFFHAMHAGSGTLDAIPQMRDKHRADLVMIMRGYWGIPGLADRIEATENEAAAYINVKYMDEGVDMIRTFAHEIGHLLGGQHNPENAGSSGADYAYGYKRDTAFNPFQTIMSYGDLPEIPYFSTPLRTYGGSSVGGKFTNNARRFNELRWYVGGFRSGDGASYTTLTLDQLSGHFSGAAWDEDYFRVYVPPSNLARKLRIQLQPGWLANGHAFVLVRDDVKPTYTLYDCIAAVAGLNQICEIPNPSSGYHRIMVGSLTGYTNARIKASIVPLGFGFVPTSGESGND